MFQFEGFFHSAIEDIGLSNFRYDCGNRWLKTPKGSWFASSGWIQIPVKFWGPWIHGWGPIVHILGVYAEWNIKRKLDKTLSAWSFLIGFHDNLKWLFRYFKLQLFFGRRKHTITYTVTMIMVTELRKRTVQYPITMPRKMLGTFDWSYMISRVFWDALWHYWKNNWHPTFLNWYFLGKDL